MTPLHENIRTIALILLALAAIMISFDLGQIVEMMRRRG